MPFHLSSHNMDNTTADLNIYGNKYSSTIFSGVTCNIFISNLLSHHDI